MNRTALIIASGMLAAVLLISTSVDNPAPFRTAAMVHRIASEPRTELLPPNLSASLITPTTTTTTAVAPVQPADTVTPYEREEWSRVNVCENGGSWVPQGSKYPDGLGISAVNWYGNGGGSNLSEDAQIMVAERIQFDPPDQDGCAPW